MAISHKRKIMAATGDDKKTATNYCRTRKRSTKRPVKAGRKKYNRPVPPWSNLHIDIVSLIMKELSLADRIRARAVCKNWLLPLSEIEKILVGSNNNKDKLPWIMSFEWRKTYAGRVLSTCRLHDPCYDKKRPYIIEEDITTGGGTRDKFVGATICASKQGWVMFYHHIKESRTCSFCLYSPFTKEVITLPDFSVSYSYPVQDKYVYPYFRVATFSSSPTSSADDCVIFVLEKCDHDKVNIRTCRCSDKTWKAHEFCHGLGKHTIYKDAVYLDGTFYCVSSDGTLAAFSETRHDWTQLTDLNPLQKSSYSTAHLVESDGELLLLVYGRLIHEAILFYAFDKSQKAWFRKQDLANRAIFLGDRYSSYSVSAEGIGEANDIANNVYFHDHMNLTNFYSFKDGKIRECCGTGVYGWIPMEGIQRIWIQPPCS